LVLFENEKGKKILYSIGIKVGSDYAHLGAEEDHCDSVEVPFREISTFSDRSLQDFMAHW